MANHPRIPVARLPDRCITSRAVQVGAGQGRWRGRLPRGVVLIHVLRLGVRVGIQERNSGFRADLE